MTWTVIKWGCVLGLKDTCEVSFLSACLGARFLFGQITNEEKQKLVSSTMRYFLMKGSTGEPISKKALNDEVMGAEYRKKRGLTTVIINEARQQLEAVSEVHHFSVLRESCLCASADSGL